MVYFPPISRSRTLGVVWFLLTTAVFAVVYGQGPLYYSNQNQYFLHGLAAAGEGHLDEDWLAGTLDPTPVFSAVVMVTGQYLPPWFFHLFYALLQGAYAAAMLGLFVAVVGPEVAARRWSVFVASVLVIHAALVRWASFHWLGLDYPWYWQAGLAGQYTLGAMFQPSTFGVLLVVSAVLFVRGQPLWAALSAGLGAVVHTTYLLPAGMLTVAYLGSLLQEGQRGRAVKVGLLTLLVVLPAIIYVAIYFGPTSAEAFATAQEVLVHIRIPHHCRPNLWLDGIACLQIAWVVLAMLVSQSPRLLWILIIPFLLGFVLTLVQIITGSNSLALLFPWRISVVLVPLATTIILARLTTLSCLPLDGGKAQAVAAIVILGLVVGGVWIGVAHKGFRTNDAELSLFEYVRQKREPGQLYFLPVNIPKLAATTRGSFSSDFKPLPEKQRDPRLIPVDLQRFRLHTGVPIFIDFKSIPYKDSEVQEWHSRLRQAEEMQKLLQVGQIGQAVAWFQKVGVTHVVRPSGQEVYDSRLQQVFASPTHLVYRVVYHPEIAGQQRNSK